MNLRQITDKIEQCKIDFSTGQQKITELQEELKKQTADFNKTIVRLDILHEIRDQMIREEKGE